MYEDSYILPFHDPWSVPVVSGYNTDKGMCCLQIPLECVLASTVLNVTLLFILHLV